MSCVVFGVGATPILTILCGIPLSPFYLLLYGELWLTQRLFPHLYQTSLDGGSQLSLKEEMEVNMIRSLISSYFAIVRQSIQDLVPKAIMHLLVNHTSHHVQDRLVSTLYKPELFSELLHEDESLVTERGRVKALLDAYKDAFKILSEVSLKSG